MQGHCHDQDLLATEGFLNVRCPSIEDVCSVWEEDAFVFGFGLLNDLEELRSNLRRGWDTSIGRASEDQEHVLACLNYFISLFIAVATTGCHWWENACVFCLSAAVEYPDNVTFVFLAHSTESVLQVVKRDLFACIGQNDLALIFLHHAVAGEVYHGQCLLVLLRVRSNLVCQLVEDLLGFGKVEILLLMYFHAFEAVLFDVLAKDLHVLQYLG